MLYAVVCHCVGGRDSRGADHDYSALHKGGQYSDRCSLIVTV